MSNPKKSRLLEAEVTEISLVKDGAVEDAEYEVLYKMADEETSEADPAEELAKAVQLIVDSIDDLEVEQAESLLKSLSALSKEDTMEEEGTEDKAESEEDDEDMDKEESMEKKDKMCKEDRLDALEKSVAELLAKLNTQGPEADKPEADAEELSKEESPLEEAERLLKERELAKAKADADAIEARIMAALAQGVGTLESVSSGLAEAKRQFARAIGQDA